MRYDFIHINVFCIINKFKILDWNTAKDKMWNGIDWYGFIGVITTSTTDISLATVRWCLEIFRFLFCRLQTNFFEKLFQDSLQSLFQTVWIKIS